jgi:cytochrome c oxidase cbb3-type subunit 2
MRFDLRSRFKPLLAAALLVALFAGVLGSGFSAPRNRPKPQVESSAEGKSEAPYAEIARVPEKERAKRNPFENDAVAIAAGGKLFAQHCAECHGNTADGGKKAPSLRAKDVQDAPPGALFWVLTNGVVRRGMPVWSKLPEPQRWQIVSFLKSLSED